MKQNLTYRIALVISIVLIAIVLGSVPTVAEKPAAKKPTAIPHILAAPDPIVPVPLDASVPVVYTATPNGVSMMAPLNLSPLAYQWNLLNLHGASANVGVRIAVIDTTVDARGSALGGRLNVVSGNGSAGANTHGSLIATAITGGWNANALTNTGAAFGAPINFYGCELQGSVDIYCALIAFENAVNSNVRIINLSFSTTTPIPAEWMGRFYSALATAEARGIVVVAATGDGPSLPFPASLQNVLRVSSMRANGKSINPHARAWAPGEGLVVSNTRGQYQAVRGSSFSTAYTTAVIARILTARPSMTPAQIRATVRGRVNLALYQKRLGIRATVVPAPRCARIVGRTLKWTPVARARVYRVSGTGLPARNIRGLRLTIPAKAKNIKVQTYGPYGALSAPRVAKVGRC